MQVPEKSLCEYNKQMLSFVLIFFLLMRLGYGIEVPISKFSR